MAFTLICLTRTQVNLIYGVFLSLIAFALLGCAFKTGDWHDYLHQLQINSFVHLISIDFTSMWLVFGAILPDDMTRRGLKDSRIFWLVTLIPLIDALAYICFRPPLSEKQGGRYANKQKPTIKQRKVSVIWSPN